MKGTITHQSIESGVVTQESEGHFISEASSLGWPPGYLPRMVDTELGNGKPFIWYSGSSEVFKYRQLLGICTLTVFND